MVDVWWFASGLVIPKVMTLAFSSKAFSGEFYYLKILWSSIINFQNFMFSWFLKVTTNRLWAPRSGDRVHQHDKAGPCHKFCFLTSPECDLVTFKCTSEIPSWLLLVYSTLTLSEGTSHRLALALSLSLSLSLSLCSPPAWMSLLPWSSSHIYPWVMSSTSLL